MKITPEQLKARELVHQQASYEITQKAGKEMEKEEWIKALKDKLMLIAFEYLNDSIPDSAIQGGEESDVLRTIRDVSDGKLEAAKMPVSEKLRQKMVNDYIIWRNKVLTIPSSRRRLRVVTEG